MMGINGKGDSLEESVFKLLMSETAAHISDLARNNTVGNLFI